MRTVRNPIVAGGEVMEEEVTPLSEQALFVSHAKCLLTKKLFEEIRAAVRSEVSVAVPPISGHGFDDCMQACAGARWWPYQGGTALVFAVSHLHLKQSVCLALDQCSR